DRASLAGLFGAPASGSVSWKLFANKACEGFPVGCDGTVCVSGWSADVCSSGVAPAAAGTYYWVASYGGDANNEGVSSGCADEPEIGRAACRERANTQVAGAAVVGATFKDRASLEGRVGAPATGGGSRKRCARKA